MCADVLPGIADHALLHWKEGSRWSRLAGNAAIVLMLTATILTWLAELV